MHAFYQACLSFLFLACLPFAVPCSPARAPFPIAPAALELVSGGAEGAGSRPSSSSSQSPRPRAHPGSGGSPPAAAASRRQSWGPGEAGAHGGPGDPGEGEVRRAE